jgi:hypothetical protein
MIHTLLGLQPIKAKLVFSPYLFIQQPRNIHAGLVLKCLVLLLLHKGSRRNLKYLELACPQAKRHRQQLLKCLHNKQKGKQSQAEARGKIQSHI